MVGQIEADQGDEQADICFGKFITKQIDPAVAETLLKLIQGREYLMVRFFLGELGRRKAGLVHPVIQVFIYICVQRINVISQVLWVQVGCSCCRNFASHSYFIESVIQHTQNIRRLIINDSAALFIPQHRYRRPTSKFRIGAAVDFMHVSRVIKRVRLCAIITTESPALIDQLRCPVIALAAERGSTFSPKAQKRLKALLPSADVRVLEGTTHFLPLEQKDTVRDAILQLALSGCREN